VRHDLAYRNDEVVARIDYAAVDLNVDLGIHQPVGDLADEIRGHLAELDNICAPIMHYHALKGHSAAEKGGEFLPRHRLMRAEGGHDIDLADILERLVINSRYLACAGVEPCVIGRQEQHLVELPALKRPEQSFFKLAVRDIRLAFKYHPKHPHFIICHYADFTTSFR